MQVTS
ncbi:uncharacterized protein FFB14_07085 [Fusarium fujikuroi]